MSLSQVAQVLSMAPLGQRKFRELNRSERIEWLKSSCGLDDQACASLLEKESLAIGLAETLIENVVGILGIPLGIAPDFLVNGRTYHVPMAIDEPSVVAAASLGARLARKGSGFHCASTEPLMTTQVQLLDVPLVEQAVEKIKRQRSALLRQADEVCPRLVERGGGAREVETRVLFLPDGRPCLVVHFLVDVQDAMGANMLNLIAETLAPSLAELTGGRAVARILSNYAHRRLFRAECSIPVQALATSKAEGHAVAERIEEVSMLAEVDVFRATTHNKGIMNGIDALAVATGNDWRAIEAGAHAWAARKGTYQPLSTWRVRGLNLEGVLELPLQIGIVGKSVRTHPMTRLMLDEVLGIEKAEELGHVMSSVGLAQNLAALRALGNEGIIRGHMALHHRRGAHLR